MASGWEGYVHMILHKYNKKSQQWTKTNICEHAAIYGLDGTAWAVSSEWPGLSEYMLDVEQDDGGTIPCKVNEFQCALAAANGRRKPSEAGIRMGNEKFVFVSHDAEENVVQLSRSGGGGAAIMKTKDALVFGIWKKDVAMVPKGVQNQGECSLQVEGIGRYIKEKGF